MIICVEKYLDLLQDAKVRGYLFEQQNYVPKGTTGAEGVGVETIPVPNRRAPPATSHPKASS